MTESTYIEVTVSVPVTIYFTEDIDDNPVYDDKFVIDLGDADIIGEVKDAIRAKLDESNDAGTLTLDNPFENDPMEFAKELLYGKE